MVRAGLSMGVMVAWLLAACGSDSAPPADTFEPPPPPPGGMQIVSPEFSIPPGSEKFICMEIPVSLDRDIYVRASRVHQSRGGHHLLAFYTTESEPRIPEPRDCRGEDMGRGGLRILGVGSSAGSGIALPEGVAFRVPAGVRVIAQSHYINAGTQPLVARDAINLELVQRERVTAFAGAFAQVDLHLELPPRRETTRQMECRMPLDGMRVPWLLPHMHEWGVHKRVELRRASGETLVLWEGEWEAAFRDHFPIVDLGDMLVGRDDVLRTRCTWHNTLDEPLLFPTEMCATFLVFHPSETGALHVCDDTGEEFVL
ncbi:MAG: hypothetical protein NZ898_16595 [Myxococcota bacterium]|nr:hypothetical protein [Myxococcota bacterium]MDW8361558.1 hypothetical protein [Myxococcales bacterium]